MPQEKYSLLAMDLRQTVALIHRKLKEKANYSELSWSQEHVLLHLNRHGESTVSELAALEGVRTQSMGATVNALKKAGYVVGHPDLEDGRKTRLSMTDAFRQKIKAKRLVREEWLQQRIVERLTEQEIHALHQALPALNKLAAED